MPLVGKDHPLTGRIWSTNERRFVTESELESTLRRSRIVLLGEQHDNPRHHVLQGRTIDALVEAGKHPVVVFEMITIDRADALRECQERRCTPQRLARAVDWDHSGWPDWRIYRPVFQAIYDHKLIAMPGGVPQAAVQALVSGTPREERAAWISRLELDSPSSPATTEAMADEIREAHCGHAPASMLDGMILAQRARDALMARVLEAAARGTSAVLIAGAGHVRNDRAVPAYLADRPADEIGTIASVAFLEVRADAIDPNDYASQPGDVIPYDFVWFTERVDDLDPCEKFRKQLERMSDDGVEQTP